MPFFLLGRNAEDELRLLSPALLATRQDAMAELSRLTAEPTFGDWDSEVFVVDLDSGIPVLLVRPATEPVVGETEDASPSAEDAAGVFVAEEPEPIAIEETVVEAVAPEADTSSAGDEAAVAAVVGAFAVGTEELSQEPADEPAPESDLRDALLRTAEQMEASGIVAPESVGAAEPTPDVSEPGVVAEAEEAASEEVAENPAGEEVPAWPWDTTGETEPPVPFPAADVAFVLDALEEPAADDASLLRGSIDDESLSAARPVILGAYDEAAPVSEGLAEAVPEVPEAMPEVMEAMPEVVEAMPEVMEPLPDLPTAEPMSVADDSFVPEAVLAEEPVTTEEIRDGISDFMIETAPAQEVAAVGSSDTPADLSDFILGLETVTTLPETEQQAQSATSDAAGGDDALDEYTCQDCVYVETCPNKDQKLPKDCISFQWK